MSTAERNPPIADGSLTELLSVADRLDALVNEALRWIGIAGGFDEHGSSTGGWINNPFAEQLSKVAVDLRDAIAELPQ